MQFCYSSFQMTLSCLENYVFLLKHSVVCTWFLSGLPHSWCHPLLSLTSYWWLLRLENTVKVEKVVSSGPSLGFSGIEMETLENKASVTRLRHLKHTSSLWLMFSHLLIQSLKTGGLEELLCLPYTVFIYLFIFCFKLGCSSLPQSTVGGKKIGSLHSHTHILQTWTI